MTSEEVALVKPAKNVGIWIRVSTEDQAKGESPEHHERRARSYAESKDWIVKEVYHLEAVSGKSVMGQPETQRMLEDVRKGRITGLIFSKLARLARNTRELLDFADIFLAHNADLISLQESIDTSTPAGRFFYTVISAMAQWEREEIADRVAASVPIRAKLGKPLGGAAPFGYQWKDRQLVPHPEEAPVRKLIYELFLEHRRKLTVARLLNDSGHRTRNGSKFTATTVDRLLRDPTAKGERRANYTKSLGEKKHWKLKPRNEWVLSSVEPIVEEELWNQCNALLDRQRANHKPPARKPVHIFSGIVHCMCGNKMYVPSDSPNYKCYQCRNKIGVQDLDAVYHEQLKGFLDSPAEIAEYLEAADSRIKEKTARLETLQKELQKVQREMDEVYRMCIDHQISGQEFGDRYQPLEKRKEQLRDQIPSLQGEIDFLKIHLLSSNEILSEARDLHSRWPQLEHSEKRKIIESITDKIIIGTDEVTIDLCYLPAPSEIASTSARNLKDS